MGYDELIQAVREHGVLQSVGELLSWDQEVMMPDGALPIRKQQRSVLAGLSHDLQVRDRIKDELTSIDEDSLSAEQQAQIREIRKDYERANAVPRDLVQEMEETSADAVEQWREARENNDFQQFAPVLRKQIRLHKQYANEIDPDKPDYEVLIEDYEDGISYEQICQYLQEIKQGIQPLIRETDWDKAVHEADVPTEQQRSTVHEIVEALGYDFSKGRLDESTHPFTSAYGRITTRYNNWLEAITAAIHEAGHGMYEHGLPTEHYGTPLGQYCTMSVHESQSRLWENHVGRSQQFWQHWHDTITNRYDLDVSMQSLLDIVQRVKPGCIRVEADEVTYNMHIILRFEIEQALFNDDITVEELPEVWNAKMEEYLGVTPENASQGVLQDIHWAMGNFGYFPTYTLGSMIAAQLYAAAQEAIPALETPHDDEDYAQLKQWLHDNIWQYGRRYPTAELVKHATGKPLSTTDYITHLRSRYSPDSS